MHQQIKQKDISTNHISENVDQNTKFNHSTITQ